MKNIAIFCGSQKGKQLEYIQEAKQFATFLAKEGYTIVYGGGAVGIMGAIADAAIEAGGEVIGVMPNFLVEREIAHPNLTELHTVDTMHERKALMADLSDAIIALPGGAGTLEEFFEMFTWAQIGLHSKPIGLYNTLNYFNPLIEMFNHMISEEFIKEDYMKMVDIGDSPTEMIRLLKDHQDVPVRTYD